jgi:hypothetical protein
MQDFNRETSYNVQLGELKRRWLYNINMAPTGNDWEDGSSSILCSVNVLGSWKLMLKLFSCTLQASVSSTVIVYLYLQLRVFICIK